MPNLAPSITSGNKSSHHDKPCCLVNAGCLFVTAGVRGCHFNGLQCIHWQQRSRHDDLFVSVALLFTGPNLSQVNSLYLLFCTLITINPQLVFGVTICTLKVDNVVSLWEDVPTDYRQINGLTTPCIVNIVCFKDCNALPDLLSTNHGGCLG